MSSNIIDSVLKQPNMSDNKYIIHRINFVVEKCFAIELNVSFESFIFSREFSRKVFSKQKLYGTGNVFMFTHMVESKVEN